MPHQYAIALGSNRRHGRHGAPAGVIEAAVKALEDAGLEIKMLSPVVSTPALGPAGRRFANAAVIVETRLDPPALLALLKRIETGFGRRRGRRWGPRVLDLDILLWTGGRWPLRRGGAGGARNLAVPHRALTQRDFVLRPLALIAPDWRIDHGAGTVRQARARLIRGAG